MSLISCKGCVYFLTKTKKCGRFNKPAVECRKENGRCGPKAIMFIEVTPPCTSCKYYSIEGLCTVFASQEPVSGAVDYFDASYIRNDENRCGLDGVWFSPKKVF